MIKKQLYLIVGILVAISVVAILVIRFVFKIPLISPSIPEVSSGPVTTKESPQSRIDGQNIWTGTLNLVEPPTLTVGDKVYTLKILNGKTLPIFEGKGYKTGDIVNVMGSEIGGVIDVSGLNKLAK